MQSNGGQDLLEGVNRVLKLLPGRDIDLCDNNEERQLQGDDNVQVLMGHGHYAGVCTHLKT